MFYLLVGVLAGVVLAVLYPGVAASIWTALKTLYARFFGGTT